MKHQSLWGGLIMAGLAGGCAVGPNYRTPDTPAPPAWSGPSAAAPTTRPAAPAAETTNLAEWWKTLNDPLLDELVARAIDANLDLRVATARVREARAQRDVVAAPFWPQLDFNGDYTYRGASENTGSPAKAAKPSLGGLPTATLRPSTTGGPPQVTLTPQRIGPFTTGGSHSPSVSVQPGGYDTASGLGSPSATVTPPGASSATHVSRQVNLFQAGFDATWELDIFGGVRRGIEAAEDDVGAAEETRRGVLVTVVSEVALNYVDLRGAQRRLVIAYENIVAQQDTVDLTRTRYQAGFTNELDVSQAEAQLATTQSQVPVLQTAIRRAIYQLSVLLGEPPAALLTRLNADEPIPTLPPNVPLGLPSDLLRRRPDIRTAERQLAAATARIGEAVADLFPKFSLTGSFGTQTSDIRHFLDAKSLFWSVGPAVSWPIWDAGRIRANIEVQNARQEEALATYEQAVLVAFQDVENALVAYNSEQVRHGSLAEAVVANQRAAELSNELYSRGLASFLNVLESQRALYATQDLLVQSEMTAVENLIALYKALGGGWPAPDEPATAAAAVTENKPQD